MARKRPLVAIDGPAGAGKSTVTRRVAEELGYLLLGTGSLYRAVALAALEKHIPWSELSAVTLVAERLVAGQELAIVRGELGEQRVTLAGRDITEQLTTEELGRGASEVRAVPGVRAALLEAQRQAGRDGGVVAEGRDIGTVVFPDAEVKFFLTASVDERSERRWRELQGRGIPAELAAIRQDVTQRDERDANRAIAPLRQAEDAELVDSTGRPIESVVQQMVARVREVERALGGPPR